MPPLSEELMTIAQRSHAPTDPPYNNAKCETDTVAGHRSSPGNALQSMPLDEEAALELHDWLSRYRFRLFGGLRQSDQQDAIEETFVKTLEFAPKMRNPDALRSACLTIGQRIRAKRIGEYIHERQCERPRAEATVSWNPERHLHERSRRKRAFVAISRLRPQEREILQRFYFQDQSAEQIRHEMQLTDTQFRLKKSRAVQKAGARLLPLPTHTLRSYHTGTPCPKIS